MIGKSIDKLVAVVNPQKALKRTLARKQLEILASGYSRHGASRTKKSLIGWLSRSGSPDEDITDNIEVLRSRSRDLFMGNPLAAGATKTIRMNVVGPGLTLNSQVESDVLGMSHEETQAWERRTELEFALWADPIDCDASRTCNFYGLQALAFISFLINGDAFVLLPMIEREGRPYSLAIRLLEGDRVCDPIPLPPGKDIRGGVEVDDDGAPVAYWVCQVHPADSSIKNYKKRKKREWTRVQAFGKKTGRCNVLRLIDPERPEQRRGVPLLAPVIESLKQLGRYTDAELMAAVVSSFFTVFITSGSQEGQPLGESLPMEERVDTQDEQSIELGSGTLVELAMGEDIKVADAKRPNVAFDGFVTSICRQIGVALGLPYEVLIKHFTSSYSASRAALNEAWMFYKTWRKWLVRSFCQPIYESWLEEAVSLGRISAPGFFDDPLIRKAYCGTVWNGPAQGQLNPVQEVTAAAKRVEEGFSTRAQETAELTGGDWEQNHRQRIREEQMREELGGVTE
jgi:lambda family phage portal protein